MLPWKELKTHNRQLIDRISVLVLICRFSCKVYKLKGETKIVLTERQ